jgi:glycosyltransferase involved in cell wall biosynthesis
MESLACGTPLAAFHTGGIPDMVSHKHNGYLAEYKSSADLAAGIAWIYKEANRAELNLQARKTVEDYFSESIIAKKHIELYKSLLNKHVSA